MRSGLKRTGSFAIIVIAAVLTGCGGAEQREAALLREGKDAYQRGDFAVAQADFASALQINANGAEEYYYLGLIAEQKNDTLGAYGDFYHAVISDPAAVAPTLRCGEYMLAAGRLSAVKTLLAQLPAEARRSPPVRLLRAAAELRQGDSAGAAADAGAALAEDPNNREAQALVHAAAMVYVPPEQNAPDRLDDNSVAPSDKYHALLRQATPLIIQGVATAALPLLQQILALYPGDLPTLDLLSETYHQMGQLDRMVATLEVAVRLDPEDRERKAKLAIAYAEAAMLNDAQGDWRAAERAYRLALAIQPDLTIAANNLAQSIIDHHADAPATIDEAARWVEKLTDTHDPAMVDTLAWIAYRRGEYQQARTLLASVAAENAADPVLRIHWSEVIAADDKSASPVALSSSNMIQLTVDRP